MSEAGEVTASETGSEAENDEKYASLIKQLRT